MRFFVFALVLLASGLAEAKDCDPFRKTVFSAEDLSGGAVTSTAVSVKELSEVTLEVDVTDADTGITNLKLEFTVSDTFSGTYRKVPDCSGSGTVTCVPLNINWAPSTSGKNFTIPWPVAYDWLKVTATPTGHGAGDALTLKVKGCE